MEPMGRDLAQLAHKHGSFGLWVKSQVQMPVVLNPG